MTYRSQKYQRGKDPFTVQPFPRSFYHPSPMKEVDEHEAIQSPERKSGCIQRSGALENFLREHSTFKTSALPDVRTLSNQANPQENMRSEDYLGSSGHLDESWRDSEGLSSPSISITESQPTSSKEYSHVKDTKMNVPDIVSAFHKLKIGYAPELASRKPEKEDGLNSGTSDSVLQRYIDRFRNSAPRSRAERLRERERRSQDFWWLNSSPPHGADTSATEDSNMSKKLRQPANTSRAGAEPKLTREALLAMDEQTLKLQKRADKLLSCSELSQASSGPMVSTDGLGTSSSVSDYYIYDEQPPFRPTLPISQDSCYKPQPKVISKTHEKLHIEHPSVCKSAGDDILSRWRLRRKMEEMQTEPTAKSSIKINTQKPHQLSEMVARLQEFRKKLLSQRQHVTSDDIQYERQRMTMLLEENQDKDQQQEKSHSTSLKDPILERLQKITGRGDIESKLSTDYGTGQRTQRKTAENCCSNKMDDIVADFNCNHASVGKGNNVNELTQPDPTLNKNNTALSNQFPLGIVNVTQNSSRKIELLVDNFDSQAVCDPKEKMFILEEKITYTGASSKCVHHKSEQINENFNIDSQSESENNRKSNLNDIPSSDLNESNSDTIKIKMRDNNIYGAKTETKDNDGTLIQDPNDECDGVGIQDKKNHQADRAQSLYESAVGINQQTSAKSESDKIYHQFLEAEKPIAEYGDFKKNETHLSRTKGKTAKSDHESQSSLDEKSMQGKGNHRNRSIASEKKEKVDTENTSDRSDVEEHSRRKLKKKKAPINAPRLRVERTSTESEAMSDVTNESDKSSRRGQKHVMLQRTDGEKVETVLNKQGEKHIGRPSRKPRHEKVTPNPSHDVQPKQAKYSQVLGRYPVQAAIGQTVVDHLFDESVLVSSVDSWASMFPQSPAPSRSLLDSHLNTPSPSRKENTPLQSTPMQSTSTDKSSLNSQADEEISDGEFEDDPLLVLLRVERKQYLDKLELIEQRLLEFDV